MKGIVGTWPWNCCEILMYFDKFLKEWDLYVENKFVYNDKVYLLIKSRSMALPGLFGFYLTCSRKKYKIYFYTLDGHRLGWIKKDFTIKHILTILNQTRIDSEDDYYNVISEEKIDNKFFRKDLFINFMSKELDARADMIVTPLNEVISVVCFYEGVVEFYDLNITNNSPLPLFGTGDTKVVEYSYNLKIIKYLEDTINVDRVKKTKNLIEFYFKSLPKSVKYIRV